MVRRASRQKSSDKILMMLVLLMGASISFVNFYAVRHLDDKAKNNINDLGFKAPIERVATTSTASATTETTHSSDTQTQSTKNSPDDGKDRLLEILRDAWIENATEYRKALPSWQEVSKRFGDEPRIIGLERCEEYQKRVNIHARLIAPAGTFNSGTNYLFEVLRTSCSLPWEGPQKANEGIFWQVNWGKHQPPRFRMENHARPMFINQHFLPIVMVRDPFSWMQSMCNVRYAAHWFHVVVRDKNHTFDPSHCPNLVPNDIDRGWFDRAKPFLRHYYNKDPWKVDNIGDKANFTLNATLVPVRVHYKSTDIYHDSLLNMWVDWYKEYMDADYPRLMVRLEDLVYHPREVVSRICACAGGNLTGKVRLPAGSVKLNADNIHGTEHTGLVKAMIKHAKEGRTSGMTKDDLQYARKVLTEQGNVLMKSFGYELPPELST